MMRETKFDKYRLEISLLPENEGGGIFIEVPDLPGCMSDGETLDEAIENVKDAISGWIETANELEGLNG